MGIESAFTDESVDIVRLAQEGAYNLRHEYLGTEHLLLGIASDVECGGAVVLKNLGIPLDLVLAKVRCTIKAGSQENYEKNPRLPFTSRAKKVLELAIAEVRVRGVTPAINSEHILLGLVVEEKGIAGQILKELGVKVKALRAQIACLPTPT